MHTEFTETEMQWWINDYTMASNVAQAYFPHFRAVLFHYSDEKQWKTQSDLWHFPVAII